jgi:hypothetical protein
MSTTTGHCLCGSIAFSYEGQPNWTLNCHCESCRRATSAPMTTWISVPRNAFRFTAGTPSYFASSPGVRRGFCPRCGSPLTYENDAMPDEVHVLAGALSEPGAAQPSAHVFACDQLPWFEVADDLPRYDKTRRGAAPLRTGPRNRTQR